jgi:hypothetical protein
VNKGVDIEHLEESINLGTLMYSHYQYRGNSPRMTVSHKVLIKMVDPYPREICVEVDRKRSVGRRALRNPPSSNTRSSKRPKI